MQGFTHILIAGIVAGLIAVYWASLPWLLLLIAAFGLGILSHGIVDPFGRATYHPPDRPREKERGARFWLPYHVFMYSAMVPAIIGLIIAFRSYGWLVLTTGIGAMFPDIIDLGYRSYIKLRGKTPKRKTWSTSTEMTFHKYLCWPVEQVANRIVPDLTHDPRAAAVEIAIDIVLIIQLILWLHIFPIF
nr:hypothetical protein [Candidatus Njordarchaeota archaeon]